MKKKSLPPKIIIKLGKYTWTTIWNLMMSQMAPSNKKGDYLRPESQFRNWINTQENNLYTPEKDRYILYVGMSCPWAHRTLIVRALKGLENIISVVTVNPDPLEGGWVIPNENNRPLAHLYQEASSNYTGRFTVPILWDNQTKTMVNNESSEIIIMLNDQFNDFGNNAQLDLYPSSLQEIIEQWNKKIYHNVNNGVYRCGFAQTQQAYEEACDQLFQTLDEIDQVLQNNRYLCGDILTLADIRLFTTLFRFDGVYYSLFKCSRQRIQDYQYLGKYLKDLYQLNGVAQTCDLKAVQKDYYSNLFPLNPGGIIPRLPKLDFFNN
jgi:putative glutathione S-transferase